MKFIKRFFVMVLCVMPTLAGAQMATTAGNNLTAWNGNNGATNNNNWNTMMNSRTLAGGGNAPKADFGNCNSLILRCAQPKCSGCSTQDVARSIVAGCVNSNSSCKQYGDDLIEYISAQIVSNVNAKMQEQQLAAQQAAAQQAAAQNSAQMQQMQQQMAEMQQQMQSQNAAQMQQMQAALEEQKALAAQAQSEALAAQQARYDAEAEANSKATLSGHEMTAVQRAAAESGVNEDLIARQTISGEILTKIQDAEQEFKTLGETMQAAFTYAGCDVRGNNCKGPKRVKIFKEKAQQFFQPYDDVVEDLYDALELSLAVGVDITDVIMMLNGACNRWGKYMCRPDTAVDKNSNYAKVYPTYSDRDCVDGKSISGAKDSVARGGQSCRIGMVVPPQDDVRCTLTSIINEGGNNAKAIERQWILEEEEGDGLVRMGCATSTLDSLAIFGRHRSKQASTVSMEVLERILLQDAPEYSTTNRFSRGGKSGQSLAVDKTKYCGVTEEGYNNLLGALNTQQLPKTVCVSDNKLLNIAAKGALAMGGYKGSGLADSYVLPGIDEENCTYFNQELRGSELKDCSCEFAGGACFLRGKCVYENSRFRAMTEEEGNAYKETDVIQAIAERKNAAKSSEERTEATSKLTAALFGVSDYSLCIRTGGTWKVNGCDCSKVKLLGSTGVTWVNGQGCQRKFGSLGTGLTSTLNGGGLTSRQKN